MIARATTDYAIRIMMFLAKQGKVVSSTDISEQTGISQKYLIKIATTLRAVGLINSQHGHSGGYILARPADEITMWEIMCGIDPEYCLTNPSEAGDNADKDASDSLLVQQMFNDINAKMRAYFEAITLAEFITRK